MREPNALIHETSPYLLQHAHNPVQWVAWNETSLERARKVDKPLLISIGYAACHWCHVMERECFEDPEVAEVMNSLFIPVKVDREERPDVDQIYMDALQIMTGSGGWPLNVVALPDGKPFWGATYLPKDQWLQALSTLGRLYRQDPARVGDYAADLGTAIQRINLPGAGPSESLPAFSDLENWIVTWKPRFDAEHGGQSGAPKFMMPVTLELLMHWAEVAADDEIRQHMRRTLGAMAFGGLFDHLAGGFSRYSVDARWHVPHFEKMLYDNAQLLGLYAKAYACYGDSGYRDVVSRTLQFLRTELRNPEGGYFASLDADSLNDEGELEEGACYVWTEKELTELLGDDFELFAEAYNINQYGYWEDNHYVLIRRESNAELAIRLGRAEAEIDRELQQARDLLLDHRNRRPQPRLDDKIITSWNGLMLSGFAHAWRYCGMEAAREAALELGEFAAGILIRPDGSVPHTTKGGAGSGHGFLEDYATLAAGFIDLFEASGEIRWMEQARRCCEHALADFSGPGQALLYFTSGRDPELIRRTLETADNVIPSSNSIMALNLHRLGLFYDLPDWRQRAREMVAAVTPSMEKYSGQYSNWMRMALCLERPFYEVVICGPEARRQAAPILGAYLPHILLAVADVGGRDGAESGMPETHAGGTDIPEWEAPLFAGRMATGQCLIYICREGACGRPLTDPSLALTGLKAELPG